MSSNPDLNLIKLKGTGEKRLKAFLLFGEHPRELISPETGLKLTKMLCSSHKTE
jgi:hypothetical protein